MKAWDSVLDGIKHGLSAFNPFFIAAVLAIAYLPAWVPPPPEGGPWGGIIIAVVVIGLVALVLRLLKREVNRTTPLARSSELLVYWATWLTFASVLIFVACVGLSAILFSLASTGSSLVPFAGISRVGAILFVLVQVASAVFFDFLEVFELTPDAFRFNPREYPVFAGAVALFRAVVSSAVLAAIVGPYGAYKAGKRAIRTIKLSNGQEVDVRVDHIAESEVEGHLEKVKAERELRLRRGG